MTHSNDLDADANGETVRMVEIENGDVEVVDSRVQGGWGNKIEFILACVGYAVGLGNVWRFPYLCQKNGGGAFLIPYFFSLFFLGVPLYYLEQCIGQRLRKGSIGVWNEISPYLGGLGIASCIVSFFVGMYYNMIIAWCLYYLGISFQSEMPYGKCPMKGNISDPFCEKAGATQYYWYNVALEASPDITHGNGFNWKTTTALLGAWVIVFVCIIKGVQSLGKAVYVTATFPYLVLIVFFFRGVTLEGCGAGLAHLFTPKFERLLNAQVWLEAATQIFFSLGLAFGGLIAMSSYNPVHNNARRDALIVSYINSGTSIFASLVVFSILGFRGNQKFKACNEKFDDMVKASNGTFNGTPCHSLEWYIEEAGQGPGLTFIAFTEAIIQLPLSPLWSILFFMMLLTLGLGSMFGTMEGILTALNDLQLIPVRKEILSAMICTVSFLCGLIFCQRSGEYWLQLFDSFSATLPLLVIGFFEAVGVCYIYGTKRFMTDIEYMVGVRPSLYWKICWMFVCPISLFVIFMASIIQLVTSPIGYNSWSADLGYVIIGTPYPWYGLLVIIFLVLTATMFIPFVSFVRWLGISRYSGPPRSSEEDDVHIPAGSITPSLSRVPLAPSEVPPSTVPTEDPDEYDGQSSRL